MGLRYVAFRTWHEIQKRIGWLKIRFPKFTEKLQFLSLNEWRNQSSDFFQINDYELHKLRNNHNFDQLAIRVNAIHQDKYQFFGSETIEVIDWHTNPETGFRYNAHQHWSQISDFSKGAGDIKYVWEKSRFTFLYDLIRYDFHLKEDQSKMVFNKIENWIDENPVNCGPNWKCSQEITLRVLNWTFALHYYKNSGTLSESTFNKILNSIYRQMQHVEENINFSRIAVRNNHALAETLGLYLTGLLFPFFPKSSLWKENGKKWFEEEIEYQIYEDGTFLQFSMNYHRVAIQLLTWAIQLAETNGEKWSDTVYERARKSLYFLRACQDDKTGWPPNYGNNDGALFFPFTDCHFRDFRPQLAALANLLKVDLGYKSGSWQEESFWLGGEIAKERRHGSTAIFPYTIFVSSLSPLPLSFPKGGYYILRDKTTTTFLRCGSYKDRPFQADNLHLDIWVDGENILQDAGSYKYNTDEKWIKYFNGTASHNTVMLGDYDQMRKGPAFVWYDWIRSSEGKWRTEEGGNIFEGYFEGFRQLGKGIIHRRSVKKTEDILRWKVEDWIENAPVGYAMNQIWHPSDTFFDRFTIRCLDQNDIEIFPNKTQGWYSKFYGQKESSSNIAFSTQGRYLKTIIQALPIKHTH